MALSRQFLDAVGAMQDDAFLEKKGWELNRTGPAKIPFFVKTASESFTSSIILAHHAEYKVFTFNVARQ